MGKVDYSITSRDGTTTLSCYEGQEIAEDKARSPVARAWLSFWTLFRGSYVLPEPLGLQSRGKKSGRG